MNPSGSKQTSRQSANQSPAMPPPQAAAFAVPSPMGSHMPIPTSNLGQSREQVSGLQELSAS